MLIAWWDVGLEKDRRHKEKSERYYASALKKWRDQEIQRSALTNEARRREITSWKKCLNEKLNEAIVAND